MERGSPCMCISTTGTPRAAAVSSAPSRRRAHTSLIMPAPAAEILIQAISEPDRYGDFSLQLGPGYAGLAVRLETASEAAGSPPEWIWEPCGQFVVGMDGVLSGVPFAHDVQFYRIRSE